LSFPASEYPYCGGFPCPRLRVRRMGRPHRVLRPVPPGLVLYPFAVRCVSCSGTDIRHRPQGSSCMGPGVRMVDRKADAPVSMAVVVLSRRSPKRFPPADLAIPGRDRVHAAFSSAGHAPAHGVTDRGCYRRRTREAWPTGTEHR
jgi:hypothetical protein